MKRLVLGLICSILALSCITPTVYAEPPKNKGLAITPLREYSTVAAGHTKNAALTIANNTDKPVTVSLTVEQFSVADYTYEYHFAPARDDWIKFESPQIKLPPYTSQKVAYTLAPPKNAVPGGHYFSLFATSTVGDGAITSYAKVGTVLYVTVAGNVQYKSYIEQTSAPWISFGGDIPITFVIHSASNSHFFAYGFEDLHGIGTNSHTNDPAHIILPGTIRKLQVSHPSPLLPGVYQVEYGYKTDTGQTITKNNQLIYLPIWFVAIVAGAVWLVALLGRKTIGFWRRQRT